LAIHLYYNVTLFEGKRKVEVTGHLESMKCDVIHSDLWLTKSVLEN